MTAHVPHLPDAFVLYDSTADGVEAMNRRTGVVYTWADECHVPIVEEIVDWHDGQHEDYPVALRKAVHAAHLDGAALLVHAPEVISAQPLVVASVLRELAGRELWSPAGRITVDNGEVVVTGARR